MTPSKSLSASSTRPGAAGGSPLYDRLGALFVACLLPVGVHYSQQLDGLKPFFSADARWEPRIDGVYWGLLQTTYTAPNLVIPLFAGALVDRCARPAAVCLLFLTITWIGELLFACAAAGNLFSLLFVGRFLSGCGEGCISLMGSAILAHAFYTTSPTEDTGHFDGDYSVALFVAWGWCGFSLCVGVFAWVYQRKLGLDRPYLVESERSDSHSVGEVGDAKDLPPTSSIIEAGVQELSKSKSGPKATPAPGQFLFMPAPVSRQVSSDCSDAGHGQKIMAKNSPLAADAAAASISFSTGLSQRAAPSSTVSMLLTVSETSASTLDQELRRSASLGPGGATKAAVVAAAAGSSLSNPSSSFAPAAKRLKRVSLLLLIVCALAMGGSYLFFAVALRPVQVPIFFLMLVSGIEPTVLKSLVPLTTVHLATAFGCFESLECLIKFVGGPMVGMLRDEVGNYSADLAIFAAILLTAAVFGCVYLLQLTLRERRMKEQDEDESETKAAPLVLESSEEAQAAGRAF
eukprot:g1.t1